jgi:predicted acetyltransferase
MSERFIVDAPRSADEWELFARIIMQALVGNVPAGTEWMTNTQRRCFDQGTTRVVREGDRVVGGLVVFDLAQYWGGRSSKCAAVSAVAIAPEHRGKGAARVLLQHSLREARLAGRSIAALYPATQALYRKLGFELAGTSMMARVPISAFECTESALTMRAFELRDLDAVRAVYAERAATHEGWLDRSDAFWTKRILASYTGPCHGYVVTDGDRIDGYIFFRQTDGGAHGYDLVATDLGARTRAAWQRLATFLAGHRSMAGALVFRTAATQLPFGLLTEVRDVTFDRRLDWMLRILDVPSALQQRGYLNPLRGEVRFAVRDPLVAENNRAWHLRVDDGRGFVTPTDRADVTLNVRGLAAVYAGYFSAHDALVSGLAEGDHASLALLASLFASRPAGLPDMF